MKKFLLFVLIFIPALAMADETGKCGDNITYRFDSSSQTLYISGQGRMYDYSRGIGFDVHPDVPGVTRGSSTDSGTRPWESYKGDIKHVIIGDGVTYIGERTFDGLQNLESAIFPSSLTEIGHTSFNDCSSLLNIYCYATRVPEHARDGLDTSSKDCKLYVPASSVDLYKQYFDGIFQKNGSKYFRYIAALQDGDPVPPAEVHVDLSDYVGYVLCNDHQVMSLEDYKAQLDAPHHSEAVGVIFAMLNDEHKTLAVMLDENNGVQFANYIPLYCGTSCSTDAFDGYQNSVCLKNTYWEGFYSPLGQWVDTSHQFGFSDYIPSYAECRLLYASVNKINATIRELGGKEFPVQPRTDEQGTHRITVEFSGDLTGLDADIWITAVEGVDGYSDIFMDGVKVNEMPGVWSNADEIPKVKNYDLTSSADCDLMTATVSLYCRNLQNPVTVTLKGYVNGLQKNIKVIDCKPGEKSPLTFTFAADGLEFEYSRTRSNDGGDCWYWTSTEDEVDAPNRAWLCSMATGSFQQTPKTERHRARAIVALDNFHVSKIASPKQDRKESKVYYSLSGQRVTNLKPGIYIQGGRKVVVK